MEGGMLKLGTAGRGSEEERAEDNKWVGIMASSLMTLDWPGDCSFKTKKEK